jgi:hypothetical protein
MRYIPLEIEFELWKNHNTISIKIMNFDTCDYDSSLFAIGFYQGEFFFDLFYWWAIRHRLLPKVSERFD